MGEVKEKRERVFLSPVNDDPEIYNYKYPVGMQKMAEKKKYGSRGGGKKCKELNMITTELQFFFLDFPSPFSIYT